MKLLFWMMLALCLMLVAAGKDSSHSHSDSSHSDEIRAGTRDKVTGQCVEGFVKNLNGYCAPILTKPLDTVPVPV